MPGSSFDDPATLASSAAIFRAARERRMAAERQQRDLDAQEGNDAA